MTSRERIRQLYYSTGKSSNDSKKKYLVIGVLVILVLAAVFLVVGGGGGGGTTPTTIDTTDTTQPNVDLNAEVSNIRGKLNRIVNNIEDIEQSQSGSTALSGQVDSILSKIE